MCIIALFTVAKTWEQPKAPSADDWIKEMWRMYTVGHDSAVRKDEILPFATTWMDPDDIILSEMSDRRS